MGEFCIKKLIVMELKDIQHFIDKEKEYISKHKNDKKRLRIWHRDDRCRL